MLSFHQSFIDKVFFLIWIVDAIKENFDVLDTTEIKTDSQKETPSQRYWVFKPQFSAAEAQLWCLNRKL